MKFSTKIIFNIFAAVASFGQLTAANVNDKEVSTFEVGEGHFLKNGKPYIIKAAELHYPRIPKEYWDNRIKLSKALGMNTICVYVFWNLHEEEPDKFDFSGNKDLQQFIELCQANGMDVIVRPGPYVCAEWEMGGLPWWLLKQKDIRLRENDPYFLERVGKFENAVAEQIRDLTIEKGGPIIMMQVENEYGSYGKDKEYVGKIRDILKEHYPETVLFQCDWSSNFLDNGLDDLLWTMNFGTGADVNHEFEALKSIRPSSPLMCSEYWSGWFDKWGANHETRPTEEMVEGIKEMLDNGISFSLYMTHGGTNRGHWAGANSPGYAPDVTSYDYDAPISESGQVTEKYIALRNLLSKYTEGEKLPDIPEQIQPISIERFKFSEIAPLFENLPLSKKDDTIKTMEEYNQGFGSILYRTVLPEIDEGTILTVTEPHDYARIFIDGEFIGKMDRRIGENQLTLSSAHSGKIIDILVEATGRINFGRAIKDFKGITDKVTLSEKNGKGKEPIVLTEWEVFNLPDNLSFYESMQFKPIDSISFNETNRLPGLYKGYFEVEKASDTFLNFETWGKGLVYVNGYPLGRIWEIGPQQTLYTPGPWLNEGTNEIMIFDVIGPREAWSEGLTEPIIDMLQNFDSSSETTSLEWKPANKTTIGEFTFNPISGWQEISFGEVKEGKYFILEILDLMNPEEGVASIAELNLIGIDDQYLPRENWKVVSIDSEDRNGGNHTADKIFDLQESTYWSSLKEDTLPHHIIVDLGKKESISGLKYLPRVENGNPGALKKIRVFIEDSF